MKDRVLVINVDRLTQPAENAVKSQVQLAEMRGGVVLNKAQERRMGEELRRLLNLGTPFSEAHPVAIRRATARRHVYPARKDAGITKAEDW